MSEQPRLRPMARVPHPRISLWQSALKEVVADHVAAGDLRDPSVHAHPLTRKADNDAERAAARAVRGEAFEDDPPGLKKIFNLANEAHLGGIVHEIAAIRSTARAYSDEDPEFVFQCIPKFIEWYIAGHNPTYRDWKKDGRGDIDYGVVEYRLPSPSRVAVLGDWGTGMEDAKVLLLHVLREFQPTAIVHLGDIYYSGTKREAAHNFGDVLKASFLETGRTLPVFNIPGNHDYYSGGAGFYDQLDTLNEGPARQPASYFCLRTDDGAWQLVGLDTGFHDHDPGVAFDPFHRAPNIHDSEVEWLQHKLQRFGGDTILLSHHQPFSAHAALNGKHARCSHANVNDRLLDAVRPGLDRIASWMWGHEHSLAIFENGLFGVNKPRLVGCSAFEMDQDEDPYVIRFDNVRYQKPEVRLGITHGWYDHAFTILDIDRGEVTASYYSFPSWSGDAPEDPRSSLLLREEIPRVVRR